MRLALFAASVAACAAATVTASGAAASVAGPGWSMVVTPSPAAVEVSELTGVACSGAGACTAVGDFQGSGGVFTLAERWNGTAFSIQPTPSPASPLAFSVLRGVSCRAADECVAVGDVTASSAPGLTLAERWDGSTWSIQRTANQGGSQVTDNGLLGVSCPAASACIAVGSYQSGDQTFPLIERWNGNRWTLQSVPAPPGVDVDGRSFPRQACYNAGSTVRALASGRRGTSTAELGHRSTRRRLSMRATGAMSATGLRADTE
jgi:hypothetical protein